VRRDINPLKKSTLALLITSGFFSQKLLMNESYVTGEISHSKHVFPQLVLGGPSGKDSIPVPFFIFTARKILARSTDCMQVSLDRWTISHSFPNIRLGLHASLRYRA
jgi:hypothetical protein